MLYSNDDDVDDAKQRAYEHSELCFENQLLDVEIRPFKDQQPLHTFVTKDKVAV